jgi:hypothetical protein
LTSRLSNDAWKTAGIPVVERSVWLSLPVPPPVKRSKKKAAEPAPPAEPPKRKEEVHEDERLRLTGAAAEEFSVFLRTQAGTLRRLAAEREKRAQAAFWSAWEILFRSDKERQAQEIDLAGRALPWQRAANDELVADVPPDRATIKVVESGLWWQPTLERRGHFKSDHQRFVDLEEALHWVETELPRLRAEEAAAAAQLAEEEAADMARVAALPATDLTPFWIDPAALEPPQITYRVYIDLEFAPAKSEKMEISFGEYWEMGKEYFTATQVAQALQLKMTQVDVQQLAHGLGYYRIFSKVTYQDAPLAAAQAQHLWDQSAFGERFTEIKVERARYGYQEVETEYSVWLGRLEQKPWAPWAQQESRAEFLQDRAMEESLCAALDVNAYRKHHRIGYRLLSDEHLIWKMHFHRSRSKFVASSSRAESLAWLQDHPQEALPRK